MPLEHIKQKYYLPYNASKSSSSITGRSLPFPNAQYCFEDSPYISSSVCFTSDFHSYTPLILLLLMMYAAVSIGRYMSWHGLIFERVFVSAVNSSGNWKMKHHKLILNKNINKEISLNLYTIILAAVVMVIMTFYNCHTVFHRFD